MKFERIAKAALLATLVTACSGDDPAQDAATATTQPASAAIESTVPAAPAATNAPSTTTTAAPVAEAPESLAFASSRDIGRLFEIAGTQTTYTSADREVALSTAEAGSLVQATSVRSRDDELVVQVRDASSKESLGWLAADSLLPTERFALTEDPSQSGELRVSRRSSDALPIVSNPGSESAVGTLASQEIAMHGGAVALAANGETYLDVIDPASRARIGWILKSSFATMTSPAAQNQSHESLRTRANSAVEYGAPLQSVTVVQVGCNAAQVEFTNPSVSLGLAVVLGQTVPQGEALATVERWTSTQGGTVYLAPGEVATITLLTDSPRTWYFAGLDEELRATTSRNADGSLVSEPATATSFQQVDLAGGSCVYVAPVEDTSGDDGYDIDSINADDLTDEEIIEEFSITVNNDQPAATDAGELSSGDDGYDVVEPVEPQEDTAASGEAAVTEENSDAAAEDTGVVEGSTEEAAQ